MSAWSYFVGHPHTRAERRFIRENMISSALKKAHFLNWFSHCCRCWPTGGFLSKGCDLHAPDILTLNRNTGQYAKTGPYNWYKDTERDMYASGILRRDYRAGGGRRASTHQLDWGVGMRGAGRFQLTTALKEWGDVVE